MPWLLYRDDVLYSSEERLFNFKTYNIDTYDFESYVRLNNCDGKSNSHAVKIPDEYVILNAKLSLLNSVHRFTCCTLKSLPFVEPSTSILVFQRPLKM